MPAGTLALHSRAMTLSNLNANAAVSLARWHEMVAAKDMSGLGAIVHPEATFRSPMAFKPYHTAQAVTLIISTVMTVFEDLRITASSSARMD